jgi:acetoacetyl-CoA reductase
VVGNFFPGDPAKDAWVEARKAEGLDIPLYGFDVSDYEQCKAPLRIVAEVPIDILVNNAGITRDKFFPKMEKGQWDAVIATNLTSLFNVTHTISPKMASVVGRIINISSRTASRVRLARPTTPPPRLA